VSVNRLVCSEIPDRASRDEDAGAYSGSGSLGSNPSPAASLKALQLRGFLLPRQRLLAVIDGLVNIGKERSVRQIVRDETDG